MYRFRHYHTSSSLGCCRLFFSTSYLRRHRSRSCRMSDGSTSRMSRMSRMRISTSRKSANGRCYSTHCPQRAAPNQGAAAGPALAAAAAAAASSPRPRRRAPAGRSHPARARAGRRILYTSTDYRDGRSLIIHDSLTGIRITLKTLMA